MSFFCYHGDCLLFSATIECMQIFYWLFFGWMHYDLVLFIRLIVRRIYQRQVYRVIIEIIICFSWNFFYCFLCMILLQILDDTCKLSDAASPLDFMPGANGMFFWANLLIAVIFLPFLQLLYICSYLFAWLTCYRAFTQHIMIKHQLFL